MLNGTIYIWYTKTRKECFTFKKKEIVSKLKKSASVVTLSKKLGVYSNVLKKNANEIERYALQMEDDSHDKKRKTMKNEAICTETIETK